MTAVHFPRGTAAVARGFVAPVTAFARRRFANPGVAYNSGNWLALAAGGAAAVIDAQGNPIAAAGGLAKIFAGSAAAVSVSLGSIAFFAGGSRYSRAWALGAPPFAGCLREGHALSAFGAACIGVGLASLAHGPLAFTAAVCGGILHASGKLGSVWRDDVWLFKAMPFASRAPALVSLLADVCTATTWSRAIAPCLLIACNLMWARADTMLIFSGGGRAGSKRATGSD